MITLEPVLAVSDAPCSARVGICRSVLSSEPGIVGGAGLAVTVEVRLISALSKPSDKNAAALVGAGPGRSGPLSFSSSTRTFCPRAIVGMTTKIASDQRLVD